MGREEIDRKAEEVIQLHLGVDREKVTQDASFIDDLGCDSLDIVELTMAFEEEFNIEIPDDVAEKFEKVSDVTDFLAKNNV